MRLSTSMQFQRNTSAMLEQQAKLSRTQLQLSTGRRVLSPSDDPAAAKRVLDLNRFIETVKQHQDNATLVQGRLELEESALTGVTNLMQRARELAVQGNNATLIASDRAALGEEVEQLLEQFLGLANSRAANGEYLFSGVQRNTQPFVDLGGGRFQYQGDQVQRRIQIAEDRRIGDTDTGFDLFMDIAASGGGVQSSFTTLQTLADQLQTNNSTSSSIADLDLSLEKVLAVRSRNGARLNAIAEQKDVNEGFLVATEAVRSTEQDLDYVEASARFQQQMLALQAAQQTFVKVQSLSLFQYL